MANQQDKIIDDIISRIGEDTEFFNNSVDTAAKKAYSEISQELSKLEKVNGNIKISVNNIKVVNSIKTKLNNLALNPAYKSEVEKFLSAYDDVEKLNQKYFGQVAKDFKPKEVYKEVKQLSIDSVKDALLGDGFKANITNKLVDVINQNMTSGGKMDDLVDQVRIFLTDTKEGDGAFSKYAKTYTTNAINKYNATYNGTITADLGLEWYKYVGSLLETSREFCKELIDAKKTGMEYIHVSQFNELLKGDINGKQIAINDKTDLPNGMPVSSEIVPNELKDKILKGKKTTEKNLIVKEPQTIEKIYPNVKVQIDKYSDQKLKQEMIDNNKVIEHIQSSGIPKNINGVIKIEYQSNNKAKIEFEGNGVTMDRIIDLNKNTITNEYFKIQFDSPYKGQGAEIFKEQVDNATKYGFKEITTFGAGAKNEAYNGYYTWARLGYTPTSERSLVQNILNEFKDITGVDADFMEMMSTKEGQNLWKEKGRGVDFKFDLLKDSPNQIRLQNYINEKRSK